MVSRLTFNFICFVEPFLLKTLRLFILTKRAISLSLLYSIDLIKRMTIFTKYSSFVYGTWGIRVFNYILGLSNHQQVFNGNASSVFTNMVNNHSLWYRTLVKIEGYSVCFSGLFSKVKKSVAIFIQIILPNLTIANLFPTFIKPIQFLFRAYFHTVQYTQYQELNQYV